MSSGQMIHRPTREQHSDQVYTAIVGRHPVVVPPEEIEWSRWRHAADRAEHFGRVARDLLHSARVHPRSREVFQRILRCLADMQTRVRRG